MWATSDMPTEATKVHSNAKPASFRRNRNVFQKSILEGAVDTSLSLLLFGLCMLQRLHPSLWYFDSWGPSCGVSHCTGVKQYQAPADEHWLQQYHKSYNNFWLLPTLPPVYSLLQLLHPCSGGNPLLQHSSSQVATWFSSPERSASCLPSTAEHSYLQKHWQMETRVSSSCIQKRGLPLYSSSVTLK